jgi:hypothetical protein
MKSGTFLLAALVMAGLASTAAVRHAAAAPKKESAYLVIDPNDFRKPVPDPEQGVIPKYDGKDVEFTGKLIRVTLDKKTKKYQYEVVHEIILRALKNKKVVVVGKETVVAVVTFEKHEKELLERHQKNLLKGGQGEEVTVQGKAEVMTDGSLFITNAHLPARGPILGREVKK